MKDIEKRIDEIIMQDRINIFDLHDRQSVVENIIEVIRQDFARKLLKNSIQVDSQEKYEYVSVDTIKTLAGLE